ncbi:MAG: SUMF1/EgtB/PvdO family nonheme iron enzyme [Deferribacteraceae bacterium]|nr:SUMF1/EgtB/PvdO family nonheme iron enzyme [Deferribacteraceae bacterium]
MRIKRILLLFGFLLVTLAILAYYFYAGILQFNKPSQEQFPIYGVDVSHHQGEIDWPTLAKQDIRFAYIKATEGGDFKDSRFVENWQGARVAGLATGAYHFYSCTKTGEEQARNFIESVPLEADTLPPVLDLECATLPPEWIGYMDSDNGYLDDVRSELHEWLSLVEARYSKQPVLYVTYETYAAFIADSGFEQYPIWIRSVFTEPDSDELGRDWLLWQYSSRSRLDGYVGNEKFIDLNVFNGDKEQFEHWYKKMNIQPDDDLLSERVAEVPANFVLVKGGIFRMGSDSRDAEKPIHYARVTSFYMSKYEVTQKEWLEIMGTNPSDWKDDDFPVGNVSWHDALEYCNKRSLKEGLTPAYKDVAGEIVCDFKANGYRLPTEAEWEYAARGGINGNAEYLYSGSSDAHEVSWNSANSQIGKGYPQAHAVGTKAANSLGLYDMSGNVAEWCWDWYRPYSSEAQMDPEGPDTGRERVIRGGNYASDGYSLRPAYRYGVSPANRFHGLRLVVGIE